MKEPVIGESLLLRDELDPQIAIQSVSQSLQCQHARIGLSRLDLGDIALGDAGAAGELLLGVASFLPAVLKTCDRKGLPSLPHRDVICFHELIVDPFFHVFHLLISPYHSLPILFSHLSLIFFSL